MNPNYLWLTETVELLALFVVAPLISFTVAYAAWRGKLRNFNTERYAIVFVVSILIAALLFAFAERMNADIRTPEYFLQLAFVLFGILLLGVSGGCIVPLLLRVWRWHNSSRSSGLTGR